MATQHLHSLLQHIRRLAGVPATELTDGELLVRFVYCKDEAAFEAMMERHGPLVRAVYRRVVHNFADVDDAFQATFLVLVSKASSIAKRESVGDWLHGVAYRTAWRARERAARRPTQELCAFKGKGEKVAAYSPDGKRLASTRSFLTIQ